ncbi:hypothetical protein EP331_07725 [bacterium]|nr:MAG: hypothetical protein EP331_07725 [bacterium]
MRTIKPFVVLAGCFLLTVQSAYSQNYEDAARYFNASNGSIGANLNTSGAFGLLPNDFQSVMFNPAMSSLFGYSTFGASLNSVYSGADVGYLSNSSTLSETSFGINELSGVFKFPVYQGSFAISAGYIQTGNFNKVFSASGFNTQNSISDYLAQTTDANIQNLGYYGYATNYMTVNNDSTLESALRFDNFRGIDQYVEQLESGQMGEFIVNVSSEVMKNLFLGASVSVPMASYTFERTYYEQDVQNFYSIYPNNVSSILVSESVDARATGVYAKLGFVFKPISWLNIGASYQTPYELEMSENYTYSVYTTFDDGTNSPIDEDTNLEGSFDYSISNPQVVQVGLGIENLNGFDAGLTLDYRSFGDLQFKVSNTYKAFELTQNNLIRQNLTDVLSISAGLGYDFKGFKPQLGFSYVPNKYQNGGYDLRYYSAGFQARVSEQMLLNFGVQYAKFTESPTLYNTADYGTSPAINIDYSKITAQVGVQIRF